MTSRTNRSEDLPVPLVPSEVDLRGFKFIPIDVQRLLKSETWRLGTGDERAAAMALWLESWHEVPAGSLPNNDRMLRKLADTEKWPRVRAQALRGWIQCSDGRLYHPVTCEKVLEAWIEKLANSISGAAGNAKRWNVQIDIEPLRAQFVTAVQMLRAIAPQSEALKKKVVAVILAGSPPDIAPESPPDADKASPPDSGGDRKGEGQGQGEGQGRDLKPSVPDGTGGEPPPASAPTPSKREPKTPAEQEKSHLWATLKISLVEQKTCVDHKAAGVLLGKHASKYGQDVFLVAARQTVAAEPVDANTYLVGLCETAAGKRHRLNGQLSEAERQAANATANAQAALLLSGTPNSAGQEAIDA